MPAAPSAWWPDRSGRLVPLADAAKGPASYFPSIEAKYGLPVSEWIDLVRGHANALVALATDPTP